MSDATDRLVAAMHGPHVNIPIRLVELLEGDFAAAAFLAFAAFLTSILSSEASATTIPGFFFLPQEGAPDPRIRGLFGKLGSWRHVLCLPPDAQVAIRKKLRRLGLLEERLADIPARLHYRVDTEKYLAFLASDPADTPDSGKQGNLVAKKRQARAGKTRNQESGKSDANKEEENPSEKDSSSIGADADAARPVGGTAAAPPNEQKKRRRRPSGIVTYYPDDILEAERLEATATADEIAAAVAAVEAAGKKPVPGLVGAQIEVARHRVAAVANQTAVVQHHSQLDLDPQALAAGARAMERLGIRGARPGS